MVNRRGPVATNVMAKCITAWYTCSYVHSRYKNVIIRCNGVVGKGSPSSPGKIKKTIIIIIMIGCFISKCKCLLYTLSLLDLTKNIYNRRA